MGQILFTAFAGGIAGLLAWLALEPSAPTSYYDPAWGSWSLRFSLALGGLIAGILGGILGWSMGSRRHMLIGAGIGMLGGALLGSFGLGFGGTLASTLFPRFDVGLTPAAIPGRILQLTPFAALVGMAVGASARSWKQALLGLTGGVVAGIVSGVLFTPVSMATQSLSMSLKGGDEAGIVGRALTSVIMGASIGLFVSFARRIARTAWLRLTLGKNEYREWYVDGPQTFIGRSEGAHVPLFGDPNIAPMHACIVSQGGVYWIQDGGTPLGTSLNGQRIQSAPLLSGAHIGIGGYVLEFLLKPGSAPARAAERLHGASYGPVQQMPQPTMPTAPQPIPVPTNPALVALTGPISGQRFPLLASIEIGREASGIPLAFDTTASRRHARVEPMGSAWQVVDLGSTNGTLVNGTPVSIAALRPGDVIQVGAVQFRFES